MLLQLLHEPVTDDGLVRKVVATLAPKRGWALCLNVALCGLRDAKVAIGDAGSRPGFRPDKGCYGKRRRGDRC